MNKLCDSEKIKDQLDSVIEEKGVSKVKNLYQRVLAETIQRKKDCESLGKPLHRIPEQLKCCYEILDYINKVESEIRDKKLSLILSENRVYKFKDFKSLIRSY